MSTTINFHEQIAIKPHFRGTWDMLQALIGYIQQFNAMIGIENMYIAYMELSNGDQKVSIKDFESVEPENALVLTEHGVEPRQAQHCVWAQDHPPTSLCRIYAACGCGPVWTASHRGYP